MWLQLVQNTRQFLITLTCLLVASVVVFITSPNGLVAIICVILSLLLVVYGTIFRDPNRKLDKMYKDGNFIISPMDGYVSDIQTDVMFDGTLYYIITLVSDLFSSNTNFIPASGLIIEIRHHDITILKSGCKRSKEEIREYVIKTKGGGNFIYSKEALQEKQIITSVHEFPGSEVEAGQKFGFMKFGNKTKLFIPTKLFVLKIRKGDKVTGGLSVIAKKELPMDQILPPA